MTQTSNITIRPMRGEEKPAVREIMRRSFPAFLRLFFSFTPDVLVAERGGELLGAIVLKTYPLPNGRKGGFVSWIATDLKPGEWGWASACSKPPSTSSSPAAVMKWLPA